MAASDSEDGSGAKSSVYAIDKATGARKRSAILQRRPEELTTGTTAILNQNGLAFKGKRSEVNLKLHRGPGFGEVSNNGKPRKSPVNPVRDALGTDLAKIYSESGVPADLIRSRSRGGARNRADRGTYSISTRQIANLIAATEHAAKIGLPFTRMITIHWQAADVLLHDMAQATGRFLDLLSKTLARHGSATAWIWVHEGGERKGGHCHILAHIPARLSTTVCRMQRGWIRRITGQPYKARVVFGRPVGGRVGIENGDRALHAVNIAACLRYLLKGACEEGVETFALERREPGGLVIGKRCGTSQNIGPKAREKPAVNSREARQG